ncbi:MAG: endolytic transglycosylase MltG, partial [Phaeodactylibacter sp.]|nr:endolytic transglycosylase MltG [Phaeodactylibacter sp.]
MKRAVITGFLILFISALGAGAYLYTQFFAKVAVTEGLADYVFEVPTNASFETVATQLKARQFIQDEQVFQLFAERMAYKRNPMRSGRFELQPGWSYIELIRHLRNGAQAPVDVVLHNERLIEEVAGKVAGFLEQDSLAFLGLM